MNSPVTFNAMVNVYLHVMSPWLSPSTSNIVSETMDALIGKMGCLPILSINCESKKSKVPLTKTLTLTEHVNETSSVNYVPVQWRVWLSALNVQLARFLPSVSQWRGDLTCWLAVVCSTQNSVEEDFLLELLREQLVAYPPLGSTEKYHINKHWAVYLFLYPHYLSNLFFVLHFTVWNWNSWWPSPQINLPLTKQ